MSEGLVADANCVLPRYKMGAHCTGRLPQATQWLGLQASKKEIPATAAVIYCEEKLE